MIGCGGFGLVALQQFTQVSGVKLVGIAGTHRPAALAAAARFGIENVGDTRELLRRDDVDLVYIATPPFLHHPQALAALQAGKHVIVEKPLALTVEQADELIAAARRRDRLLVTNLMQRYNPLFDAVRGLVEDRARVRCFTGRSRTTLPTSICRPSIGSGIAARAAASLSSTEFTSSTCSPDGLGRGRSKRPKSGFDRARRSKNTFTPPCATRSASG